MKQHLSTQDRIYNMDCIDAIKQISDQSVDCIVTSPPYFGLRDYGTGTWEGGDEGCSHRRDTKKSDKSIIGQKNFDAMLGVSDAIYKTVCRKCGAIRKDLQIGLEETPDEYVAKLVDIFRQCKRILKDDGTLWLNLGDSYNGNSTNRSGQNGYSDSRENRDKRFSVGGVDGLKSKDLIGIPWMVAFALRADGWYLRQDIIWHKPNPMPESVKDRCTKSHEYIFLLSKSKQYYYDADAIKEPVCESSLTRAEYAWNTDRPSTKNASMGGDGIHTDKMGTRFVKPDGRNKRSVWTICVNGFKEAHFATFPIKLIEPCILAGSRKGGTVFDPFMGAGTTAITALKHGRHYLGAELNPAYVEIAENRIKNYISGQSYEMELNHV